MDEVGDGNNEEFGLGSGKGKGGREGWGRGDAIDFFCSYSLVYTDVSLHMDLFLLKHCSLHSNRETG